MKLLKSTSTSDQKFQLVDDETSFSHFFPRLKAQRSAAWDVEHDGKGTMEARPVTMQFYWGGPSAYMVTEEFLPRLQEWWDSNPTTIGYSIKGDMHTARNSNIRVKGKVHDVMVVDYMTDENTKVTGDYEESLKKRYADTFGTKPRLGWGKEFGKSGADKVIKEEGYTRLLPYGCMDVIETWEMHANKKKALERLPWVDDDNMFQHFEAYEAPYTRTLFNMERRGCYIDTDYLEEQVGRAGTMMEELEHTFYTKARESVNDFDDRGFTDTLMGSWQQLGKLFYDVLGYPEQFQLKLDKKLGKKVKKRTINEEAMATLAKMGYELPKIKDDWKKIEKLKGTYLEGILKRIWKHRIHTEFIQAFTLTGRLSSRNPNLQNIPRPENDPFNIRDAFIPSPGMMLVSLDYSQIEVRIAAQLSGDKALIEVCKASDIYVAMAQILYPDRGQSFWAVDYATGKPANKEAGFLRQVVKAIVLGVIFGKQAKSIAEDLRITELEAERFIRIFFKRFHKLWSWMEKQKRDCRRNGFVRTLTGRYRRIPDINLPRTRENWFRITHAERQTLNSPVQGSAFDIIEIAQLNLERSGVYEKYGGHMLLSVHDEIISEFPNEKSYTGKLLVNEKVIPELRDVMINPFPETQLMVPLAVSGSAGISWMSCK